MTKEHSIVLIIPFLLTSYNVANILIININATMLHLYFTMRFIYEHH